MTQEPVKKNRAGRIARVVLRIFLFIILFVLVVFLLILTPPAQKFLTSRVENYLENKLHTKVEIGRIAFGLSGEVSLKDIYLEDRTKDTLLSGGLIKANLSYLKLFSNEVEVQDIELQNITAKIKRVLPDTAFNFQFIVDAFTSGSTESTSTGAPMKLEVSDVTLENINLQFTDVISGTDLRAKLGNVSATIDTLDLYQSKYNISSIIARNVKGTMKQIKPLVEAEPLSEDLADAKKPAPLLLSIGKIDFSKIDLDYANDVSAFYGKINIGQFKSSQRLIDLVNNRIYLDDVLLDKSKIDIRLGKSPGAREVAKQASQEVEAQKTAGWDFRIGKLAINGNTIKFDNDNSPRLGYGLDYSHLDATGLTLHVEDFVMNTDSIGANITEGRVKDRSGLNIQELRGEVLYAQTQSYLKDLYIKTPGSVVQRYALLEYRSYDDLVANFARTKMDIELKDTKLQVKDILLFAPQLRNNPVLKNPNDVWYLNLDGSGTMDRLVVNDLNFKGLSNSSINARGTLVNLTNPQKAGGNFTIYKLHTNQTDIALFTGQRLDNAQMNLPESFDISGTVSGNSGAVKTNLDLASADGNVKLDGTFSNLANPAALSYNAFVSTRGLKLGKIIRQPAQIGSLSGNFRVLGRGTDPATMNTRFNGTVYSLGYNDYTYHNAKFNGTLIRNSYNVTTDINDPNIDLNLTASGDLSNNPTIRVKGMIDSIKTGPLNLTPQPMVFRGAIDGTVSDLMADNPTADVEVTQALLVANNQRVNLDSIQLKSGTNAEGDFISLKSDFINASVNGEFSVAELGSVIQNTIQPYFNTDPKSKLAAVKPYDFGFTADIIYSPAFAAFVPGLTAMEPLHADGRLSSDSGLNAKLNSEAIVFNGTAINNLNITANTGVDGLKLNGNVASVKSGTSLSMYNVRLNATALNNQLGFNVGVDDPNGKLKYYLKGDVTQPRTGAYALSLSNDSLMLNYDRWNVNNGNSILFDPTGAITANNLVLSNGDQRLTVNTPASSPKGLDINFDKFQLSTITAFVNNDSLFVNGTMNGVVKFPDLTGPMLFTSNLNINDLTMKQDTVGNVNLQVSTGSNNRYITNATITGHGNDVALSGSFAPAGEAIDLDLDLNVRALQLRSLQGPLNGLLTNSSGALTGNVKIQGNTLNPDIAGKINFDQASFAVSMLGSQFRVDNESINITNDGIRFDDFTIRDSSDNRLTINGDVLTSNYINYQFNLDVDANNFQVLNSSKAKNKLYYGKLFVTSRLHVAGDELRPYVDGNLSVNDGTELSIVVPQSQPGVVEREGIVEFVDMDAPGNDTLFVNADSLNYSTLKGVDIAVNIEIVKEAIFNVIVDEANGDFLNVRGEAQISTGIDPSGKITMVGNYELEEGAYQISFNFLQRKFNINRGSTITWTGEPTTAQLNVGATYVANTAPLDLVADQISASTPAIRNTYLQRLPFEVRLNLTGELMKPIVDFDIVLPEGKSYGVSNDIVTAVQSRLTQIRQDEGEVNKQVFSLLLLGRFVGENPFESSGEGFNAGTYARQSVSKLLTEQLNSLAAGLINGVDLNFDLTSVDDYTTGDRRNRTNLNVGLSKRLLNDRLKVTVGSDFQLEGAQNNNSRASNVAGNIAVDYSISRDGRYMLRFFRRNDNLALVSVIENGVSFIFAVDYNRFVEILRRKRQRVTPNGTTTTTNP